MPNINIDDAYILNETGAQVDKVTGLFTKDEDTTSGEKAFAQLNIGTAGSNRSLLDNPWFTVRQRGNGSFSGAGYTVDRWKIAGGNVVVTPRSPYGVNLNWTTACAYDEYFDIDPQILVGKTVTLSAMVDGVVYSQSAVYSTSGAYVITITVGNVLFRLGYFTSTGRVFIRIGESVSNVATNVNVDAVKLELGSVSTLANDAPPEYGTELLKCMRYFIRIKPTPNFPIMSGFSWTATNIRFVYNTPVVMRGNVTVSRSGGFDAVGAGGNVAITGLSAETQTEQTTFVSLAATTSGATPSRTYLLFTGSSNAYIDLSADL